MTLPPIFIRLEKAFTVAALLLYSGGPFSVLLSGGYSQGDPVDEPRDFLIMKVLFISTYCIFTALLVCRWRQTLQTLLRDRGFTLLFVALVAGSLAWSATPDETFTNIITFIGTTLFGVYLAGRYSQEEQLELLAWTFGSIVCLSFFYAIALPKYGIMGGVHQGAWRGIYKHKNGLGKVLVLSIASFVLRAIQPRRPYSKVRIWPLLGLTGSVILLALCTSKGALVNACVLIAVIVACLCLQRSTISFLVPCLIGSFTFALGSSIWIFQNLEAITNILNKDVTLTGRTTIWALTLGKISERPWLGYGFFGFWNGLDSEAGELWRIYDWNIPTAHNGFLDLLIHLGFIGFALFLMSFTYNAILCIIQLRQSQSITHIWPLVCMVYMLMGNLTESQLLKPNDLLWLFYVALSLQPYQLTQQRPQSRHSSAPEVQQNLEGYSS